MGCTRDGVIGDGSALSGHGCKRRLEGEAVVEEEVGGGWHLAVCVHAASSGCCAVCAYGEG